MLITFLKDCLQNLFHVIFSFVCCTIVLRVPGRCEGPLASAREYTHNTDALVTLSWQEPRSGKPKAVGVNKCFIEFLLGI